MVKHRFRHLLVVLAVLLMLPQGLGAVAAAESAPDAAPPMIPSALAAGGAEVSDFYNTIMQVGADPWVYKHTDGYYYNVFVNASGVMIRRATTITGIDAGERRLAWTPVPGTMYSSNVWAPEMHYLKDTDGSYKWYIYFAADNGTNANHRMYVLENASANPMIGTWEFKGKITDPSDKWAIDGTVLTVDDQHYFIWSGWEENDGSFQNIYIAEMSDPRTISSERVLLSTSEYDWESSPARINEGPQVNIRNNTINLVYSANGSWTDSYCLGLITAEIGDDLMDPDSWAKRAEPIFSSANGVYGPGHHSLTTSPDGSEDWIIYHAARWPGSGWTRNVKAQKFTWNADGTPQLGEPVDPNTPIAKPSGEPTRVRYEAEAARLGKDPNGVGSGPVVRRDVTASGGVKLAGVQDAGDYAQFTVDAPDAGFYLLSVRNANGTSGGTDASQLLSVNGGPGARLSIVYSGWQRWGLSTAKVYLAQGDNTIAFSGGTGLAEIDSMDVFKLEAESELLFESPGFTLGLGESRSLDMYTLTGTTANLLDSGVVFSSSDVTVVSVDGMSIQGLKSGTATITASHNGQTASTTVIVAAEPKAVQSVAVSGVNSVLAAGQTGQLSITARYNTLEETDVTANAVYASSNPGTAEVTAAGAITNTAPGETVLTASYGGKEASFRLTVTSDPSQLPQIAAPLKAPSGSVPTLPGTVDVVYMGEAATAMAEWNLAGISFHTLGIVQVPVQLTLGGESFSAAASVEVVPGWGLDEIVSQVRNRLDSFSYPIGEGLGTYSLAAYNLLLAALAEADGRSADADMTEEQFHHMRDSLEAAENTLFGSLSSTQDGVFYNAYRDFSGDEPGKFPFGITIEDMTNGATATVQEEGGNKFLRLTTTAVSGKANLFLPYLEEVAAEGNQRIVVEYRARLNSNFQYANGAMVRNDSGTGNYSMVTAFDGGKIVVQNGASNKVKVQDFQYNTWYKFRMEANWGAKTYSVYIDDNPIPAASNYAFRHTGGTKLTGQRFGIDGYANASIDYDDFKVMVIGGAKLAPEGLGTIGESLPGASDGSITGVNASMQWSSNGGGVWSQVEGNAVANLPSGTYWVRYAETATHKASPHVVVTIGDYQPPSGDKGIIAETGEAGDFPLAVNGTAASIWLDAAEAASVRRVATDLKEDIKRVTGLDAAISTAATRPSGPVIIVGTLAGNSHIQSLIAEGGITAHEASAIEGKWEAYLIKAIDNNTLVVAGSDPRGAIFGVYEISEQMGVSPWYFFADAAIPARTSVYAKANTSVIDMPDVQYRGIFLNDEEKLSRWATEVFKDPHTMGPKTYAKIFELILRLKGNYIWAAMHVNSINNVPGNIDLVQEYGIVLGSSHPDMLLRTNVHEWDQWKRDYAIENGLNAGDIKYDYTVSKEALLQYWRENIERHKDTDAQWTLGMRGLHDEPFDAHNLMTNAYEHLGNNLEDRKAGLMNEIIRDQQALLVEVLGQDKYEKSFQAFIPYKEVLPIYNNPTFDLPDNVAVIWCDDNHGMMRRMPDAAERAREGGHGLYYHVSYWAPVDQSYMWLSSLPLALMGEELGKSWDHNIRKSWILNIGDIKPQEAEMTFFIRYGWDVEKYDNNAEQFLKDWIGEQFGSEHSDEGADILNSFYQHTIVRKLEHMKDGLFNLTHFGDEGAKRMAVYQDLFDRAAAIYQALPEAKKLSFYELVQSKINWAYYVNKAYYYADKSNLAFDQGRMASADAMLELSQEADLAKKAEIAYYSTIANGKWKGFIDPEFSPPPVINQLPPGTPALVLGDPSMGVIVQGETLPGENDKLVFAPYNQDGKFIDIFNKGAGSVQWTASSNESWVQLSSVSGTVHDETRIWVTIDDMEARKGGTASITITDTTTSAVKTIQVQIESPAIALADITGYAEADGYVSMEAEHYSRMNANGNKVWQVIRDAGRAFGKDVVRAYGPDLGAIEESAIATSAPSLEYDINLTSSGEFPLEVYRIPTLNAKGKVRFAVSVDDGAPIIVESAAADEGQGTIWVSNLFHMIEKHVVRLPSLSAGQHTVKLWMVDNFIMIDKLVLYTGPNGVIASELGPDESYHHEYRTTFNPGVVSLPRTTAAAEPKNIPAGWGAGAFVETDGKVSLEAEYAMENVLESENEITADMKAYTVSKRGKAALVEGKIPNGWRLTQSDTGMAMRLPDLGGQWSEDAEFPVYSPELTYNIQFGNTGTYNVWVRWRYVDNASDSIRGGLNGSLGDFPADVYFSNSLDEKWHWKKVGKVTVPNAAEHDFSLWMREDGLYIDRIYLTKSGETPTDALWSPSLRTESAVGQRLQAAVNVKRAEMSAISYPTGDAPGHYRQAAFDALMTALEAAEVLAESGALTDQQADDALGVIAAAEAGLKDALVLVKDGINYHAYRDFTGDETGKFPYGFNIEGLTNGAAASVQEEDGNRFLRLTTTSSAGKADLFLPYVGEVAATGDQRIVIEYRARFNGSFQYANGAMVRNDSGTGNYSMVTAFENATGVHQIKVHKGTSSGDKVSVKEFQYNQWHTFKMVANWDARTYTVYMDNDPDPVAENFDFRHKGGNKLTGQRFGIDNMANGSIDYDDFKVSVIGGPKAVPEGLGTIDESAAGANDGRITGVNASMEWSSDNGVIWSNVEGDEVANLSPGTYWIRYRETDAYKASPHVALILEAYEETRLVTGVSLDKTDVELYTNFGSSTVQLAATVEPAEAVNKAVTWTSSNPAVATVDGNGLVHVHAAGTAEITVTTADGGYTSSCVVTVSVHATDGGSDGGTDGGSNGGSNSGSEGSSTPTVPVETIQNADGSSTTIVTDQAGGAVTETTSWPNGDRQVVTKERNGTVKDTFTGQDGSRRETVTRPDGSSHSVVVDTRGVELESVTSADGAITTDVRLPLGLSQARVTLPLKKASAATVAYIVRADGSRQIVRDAVWTESGLSFIAKGDMTVKLMDNGFVFKDVPAAHWGAEAIAFVASRELFLGTGQGLFDPSASMSRAMLFTVLARLEGVDTEGGAAWYSKSQDWAVAAGISDGSAPEAAITREQLITLLYRYAGRPAVSGVGKSFADSGEIAAWASEAMDWAVEAGILQGKPGNLLAPAGTATRAEVSVMLERFIRWQNNRLEA